MERWTPDVSADNPIVDVVFIQDWTQESDAPGWGDWAAMGEYLSRWDYGTETDDAHTLDSAPFGAYDDSFALDVGGLRYWLTVNHGMQYAGLTRRPL